MRKLFSWSSLFDHQTTNKTFRFLSTENYIKMLMISIHTLSLKHTTHP